ncbi:MAG: flippase activity-associated protein Agl23, partial [Sedimentisphaerales bacterium]
KPLFDTRYSILDTRRESRNENRVSRIEYQVCSVLIVVTAIVALALRLPRLQQRPMHTDEAVHAIKFGELLEQGRYTYNPYEFHGPTLNYLTLIPAWLSSTGKLTEVSEFTLRIVPVFFGVLLVLLLLFMVDGLGSVASAYAAVLTAISPVMVFYSRYYIQETLLVCFTFGTIAFGYRYTQTRDIIWVILCGACLGLMHATKETSIIAFGSMFLAVLLTRLWEKPPVKLGAKYLFFCHLFAGLSTGALISALFYSSFFTNPNGIWDSFRTYATYFNRATTNSLHFHRWYYYLKMLIYSRYAAGPVWSEAVIVFLAVVGFIVAVIRRMPYGRAKNVTHGPQPVARDFNLLRFIAFYTLTMTIVYSTIRHKTPWCMLGLLHGMVLLAGVGACTAIKMAQHILPRLIVICLLIAASGHLVWQTYLANYVYYADPRNPYVYAHTTTDVFTMVQRIEEIAEVHEDGKAMEIHFICPDEHDFWPFPWYLRSFPNVGYFNTVTDRVVSASVIIASASVEQELLTRLYELPPPGQKRLYVPLFDTYMELRPQIELRGYVPKDLWDRLQQRQNPASKVGLNI